jgi:hypothetical protein
MTYIVKPKSLGHTLVKVTSQQMFQMRASVELIGIERNPLTGEQPHST